MDNEIQKSASRWISLFIGAMTIGLSILGAFLVTKIDSLGLFVFLILGLIVLAMTLWKIEWGLFSLIVMTYARISDVAVHFYGAPSIAQPFIAFLALLVIIRWFVNREIPRGWLQPSLTVAAYGILIFLSLIYAGDPERAQAGFVMFMKDAIIAIMLVLLIQSKESFRMASWGFLSVGILLGTIAIYQYLTGTFRNPYWGLAESEVMNIVSRVEGYRIMGTFRDPNFFAQVMVVIIPIALNRIIFEKKLILKVFAFWSFATSFLTVIYTFSRGGFLALCAVIGLLILWKKPPLIAILSGLLILIMLIPLLPVTYFERIQTILDYLPFKGADVRTEVSFRGRLSEYEVGWQMFLDNPILGIGYENYPANYLDYSIKLGLDPRRTERSAHSLYLEILAEQGLIGFLLFGFLIFSVFRSLNTGRKTFNKIEMTGFADLVLSFQIGLVGYLSAAVFIHLAYPRNLWLLIGVGLSIGQMAVNEERKLLKAFYNKRISLNETKMLREGGKQQIL